MTRIIEIEEDKPYKLEKSAIEGDAVWICRCGLTGTAPFCDGSHKAAQNEPDDGAVGYDRTSGVPVRGAARSF